MNKKLKWLDCVSIALPSIPVTMWLLLFITHPTTMSLAILLGNIVMWCMWVIKRANLV